MYTGHYNILSMYMYVCIFVYAFTKLHDRRIPTAMTCEIDILGDVVEETKYNYNNYFQSYIKW